MYTIRKAHKKDSALIFSLIKELAVYEKLEDQVEGSVQALEDTLFGNNPKAEALIFEEEATPIGFAVYTYNYSTFLCRYGIYIEDIYIQEHYRGKGYGKLLFREICKIAKENHCGRVDWSCLDWNKPSIDFYLKLGAQGMADWTVYRLDQTQIDKIAREDI